jgi:hypothetical protein
VFGFEYANVLAALIKLQLSREQSVEENTKISVIGICVVVEVTSLYTRFAEYAVWGVIIPNKHPVHVPTLQLVFSLVQLFEQGV